MTSTLGSILDELAAARQAWGRVGEHWPQGPKVDSGPTRVDLAAYLGWVRALDAAVPARDTAHHALRRLHYSGYIRRPNARRRGRRLDALLAGDPADYPLTWGPSLPGFAPTALDRLYSISFLDPPLGVTPAVRIDLGAVFTATDAAFAGPSDLGVVAEQATGVPFDGIATWVGDLATWFLAWNSGRVRADAAGHPWTTEESTQRLLEAQRAEAPLEMMLGSLDGYLLADHYQATVSGSFDTAPAVADSLRWYYSAGPPAAPNETHPYGAQRFARFVQRAATAIRDSASGSQVAVSPTDAQAVRTAVAAVAAFFLFYGRRDAVFGGAVAAVPGPPTALPDVVAELAGQAATVQTIANQFVALLQDGLSARLPASWPTMS